MAGPKDEAQSSTDGTRSTAKLLPWIAALSGVGLAVWHVDLLWSAWGGGPDAFAKALADSEERLLFTPFLAFAWTLLGGRFSFASVGSSYVLSSAAASIHLVLFHLHRFLDHAGFYPKAFYHGAEHPNAQYATVVCYSFLLVVGTAALFRRRGLDRVFGWAAFVVAAATTALFHFVAIEYGMNATIAEMRGARLAAMASALESGAPPSVCRALRLSCLRLDPGTKPRAWSAADKEEAPDSGGYTEDIRSAAEAAWMELAGKPETRIVSKPISVFDPKIGGQAAMRGNGPGLGAVVFDAYDYRPVLDRHSSMFLMLSQAAAWVWLAGGCVGTWLHRRRRKAKEEPTAA